MWVQTFNGILFNYRFLLNLVKQHINNIIKIYDFTFHFPWSPYYSCILYLLLRAVKCDLFLQVRAEQQQQNLEQRFGTSKMHLSPTVA